METKLVPQLVEQIEQMRHYLKRLHAAAADLSILSDRLLDTSSQKSDGSESPTPPYDQGHLGDLARLSDGQLDAIIKIELQISKLSKLI